MANNNDFIQVVARLNETKSANIIKIQLNEIQKKLQLQLSDVKITSAGQKTLQDSINAIQNNLKVNIDGVNLDQNKMIHQVQQATSKINSSIKNSLGSNNSASSIARAFDISGDVANKLKKRYTDVAVLANDLQSRFKNVGTVTTEVFSHENQIIDGFRATITNTDGAVEKLTFHLKQIEGTSKHQWEVTGATFNDNNIKLQEQALKSARQEAKQLEANVTSGYKTLTHYVQMMNNLSQRQVFNKNASSENVMDWQAKIAEQNEAFKKLKATMESGVVTPAVLNQIKELSGAVNDVILKGHEMARTLGQSTSNVNAEAELNNLKTLMNNLKASDVEVEKLKADYGELIGLFVQAEDTGDFSQFFNRLTVFKSKFAEAKSEVRATNAEIADLASMAKQLQSNKLTNFFSRNVGDVRVTGLKTEIAGLITEWDALNNEIAQTGQITPSTQAKIDSLRTRMEQTTVAADQLQKSIKEDAQAIRLMTQKQSLSTRIQAWLQNNTRASEETRAKLMELQAQIQSADAQQMTNLNNQLRQITSSATAAGEAGMKLGDLIKQKLAKFTGWFSIATVVMRAVRYIREMVTTVRELDTAMTGLRKVSKATEQEYNSFFITATKNAKELGASIKDIVDSTAEFARLGYQLKDASILSEVATLYKNVGDGINIDEATTSIISTMKAFDLQSSEVETQIVDKFNKVGNEFAISAGGIGEALQRSASALANAKNDISQSIALTVAANNVIQNPESVGNMWKTVALRMTKAKSELEQMGEDTDYMVTSTAELQGLIKGITGYDILEADQQTLKSTYDIVLNIGKVWKNLSDLNRNSLLYALAGTRQSNALAAALTNISDMEAAYEAAENSAGSAREEQEKYARSIQYSLDVLKATGEELSSNVFDSQGMKDSVDAVTKFLEVINKLVKSVGTLGTALTAVITYKGFKSGFGGTGLLNYFNNTKTGFTNFFTQRQLSDDALTLGITHDDVKLLTDYDKLLKATTQDTTAMATTMSRMSPAAQTFATNMQTGAASVESLTVATQAAQVGMKLLHATLSMGATLLISYGVTQFIKKMDELIVTEKEAKQQHDELIESINSNIDKRNAEQKEIQALIKEYQSYGELTSYTVEQKEQLKNIQDQLIDTYGLEAEGIDLVNGKYEEQIKLLDEKARKEAKENNANLWAAYEETKSDYDNNSGYSFKQIFNANSIGTKDKGLFAKDVYEKSALKKAFSDVFEETTKITGLHYNNMEKTSSIQTQEITFALRTVDEDGKPLDANAMLEQVLAIQDRIDKIRRDSSQQSLTQSAEFIALQEQVAAWTKHYRDEVDANNDTLTALAKNLALTTAVNIDGVDYYADTVTSDIYNEFAKKLIGAYNKTNPEVADAIRKYLDDTYGEAFGKASLSRMEVEAKKAEEYRQAMLGSTYDYEDYKEEINGVTKSVQTLSSAYEKLKKGEVTDSDLLSLFDEFPELSAYANDTEKLAGEMEKLARSKVSPLVESLDKLRKTVKDPDQIKQLDGMITLLAKLGNLSAGIEETADALSKISASDYIKYDESNIQRIIDKLEKEKDTQNDILDSLKSQKEELEEIISDYEKTADVVGKFIDRTEIEPLNDRKAEIEEYYNTEIEKLKEENAERDRNIELQEKQDTLANARKTKVRVYSETQGWHYENDVQAIQKAENELSDLKNEITIDNLEKQRDAEINDIEKEIKAWEEYKNEWKKQVESITEADEELIASKVLGSDWHEKIANKDIGVMDNFRAEYVSYNNKLKYQVNVEIANIERVISKREKEINDWKDYKTEISNLNDEITDSNAKYLKNLNQFVLDENSIWQDRVNHLMKSKEIVARLNEESVGDANLSMQDALEGSGLYGIMKGDQILETYVDKADALKARERLIREMIREQVGYAVPDVMIEAMSKRLVKTLEIKKFARGGVASYTGLAWMDGTKGGSEVVFNQAQANELYNIVKNGNFGKMVTDNILSSLKDTFANLVSKAQSANPVSQLHISFPNAQINAKDYDSFKGFMDRYTTDLLLKMQVGL